MPLYTREELETQIAQVKEAISACISGKSYTIDGRSLTRQDLEDLRAHLNWLYGQLAEMTGRASTILARPRIRR